VPYYRRVGDVPPKRHTVHRDGDGNRMLEELVGIEGFAGASSLVYHRPSPSSVLSIESVPDDRPAMRQNHPVSPLHLLTGKVDTGTDAVTGRRPLLGNADLTIAVAGGEDPSPRYRDAVGDELVFVLSGSALLESVFGALEVGAGDYVVIPRGVAHRWIPAPWGGPLRMLVIETTSHVATPRHYLTAEGQFVERAPYCERDLRAPDIPADDDPDGGPVDLVVRTRSGLSRHRLANDPFDAVGWDGCCYPYALAISDFEPIVGRLHQPPPVHQTFAGEGFVVCSFVPRPFDFHPDAVKVPYFHSNVDSDEVLFYVDGDFMSRAGSGIDVGSITVHPSGFVHGPQPGSWERSVDATSTNETAVMIDTFRPLEVSAVADSVNDEAYLGSWWE